MIISGGEPVARCGATAVLVGVIAVASIAMLRGRARVRGSVEAVVRLWIVLELAPPAPRPALRAWLGLGLGLELELGVRVGG